MSVDYSKLHSIESEQSVIGALLIPNSNGIDHIGSLKAGHFYTEAHRIIFSAILRMHSERVPVDVITLAERLERDGLSDQVGGLVYLGDLCANTPSAANISRYASNVVDRSMERDLLAAAENIAGIVAGSGATADKLIKAQSAVMSITEVSESKQPQHIRDVLVKTVDALQRRSDGVERGFPTGLVDLDSRLSGGLRPGNLVIVAGRPAMGKTALATCIAYNMACDKRTALIMSMEMSDLDVNDRLLALSGRVPLSSVLAGEMDGDAGDRIMVGVQKLNELNVFIHDQGGMTIFDVISKARNIKRRFGLGVLVIDYLQLMLGDGDGKNRNQELEVITRGLKSLAKELEIPIILLSQLNRKVEERTNKRPMMSDLRESGAIEQDADIILMCYRDEYYNPDSSDKGTAEVIISKNRQGSAGVARLAFVGEYTSFENLSHDWRPSASDPRYEKPARKAGFGL